MNLYIMLINNALYVHGLLGKYGIIINIHQVFCLGLQKHMWEKRGASEWFNEEIPIFIVVEFIKLGLEGLQLD